MKKPKYKSIITKRIFGSLKKIASVFGLLFLILSFGKIQGTNSFFTDSATVSGNTMTAGYWVPPTISIASPSMGDDAWQIGSVQNIRWDADSSDLSATGAMKIDLDYKCGIGSYSSIATGEANDGSYAWTIPSSLSDECFVRVTATDVHLLSASKESDEFEISWMVVLNEFVPNPIGDDDALMPKDSDDETGEWVELYNRGDAPVDVSGWFLYDVDDGHKLEITTSNSDNDGNTADSGETIVPVDGFLVVYRNGDHDFSLNNNGDSLRLFDGEVSNRASLIDSHAYDGSDFNGLPDTLLDNNVNNPSGTAKESIPDGKSFIRYPDGFDNWIDPIPTPGKANDNENGKDELLEYYKDACFDKKGKPICDLKFLKSLGLIDDKSKPIVENKEIVPATPLVPEPIVEPAEKESEGIVPGIVTDPIGETEEKPKLEIDAKIEEEIKVGIEEKDKPEAQAEVEVKAKLEVEAKVELDEKAKLEAEQKAKADAEEKIAKAKMEAEAEEKAKLVADAKAKVDAEEKAKKAQEEKAEAEKAKKEAEAKAKKDEEKKKEETKSQEIKLDEKTTE